MEKRQRIEESIGNLELGSTFVCKRDKYTWIYIGRRLTKTGFSYMFVREANLHWHYECAFYDTLCKKFNVE